MLVSPSRQEGFGIGIAEALASGVPAVVTPSGGPEELVRRSGGGRVTSGLVGAGARRDGARDARPTRARLAEQRRAGRAYVETEHSPARFRELLAAAFRELDG